MAVTGPPSGGVVAVDAPGRADHPGVITQAGVIVMIRITALATMIETDPVDVAVTSARRRRGHANLTETM